MKLKIGESVYLQKYEAADMAYNVNYYPPCVQNEIGVVYMSNPKDGLRFSSEFKDPESVKWLMEQDWIVDFDEYSKKSLQELNELGYGVYLEETKIVRDYNREDSDYREEHFDEVNKKIFMLEKKAYSIGVMISFLEGRLKFKFPKGYKAN